MKLKTLVINAVLAALYIAVSAVIQPIGFSNIQFRVSEIFNHLIVFNKKYIYGIILGVFLTNLFFSPPALKIFDIFFGVGMSLISLLLTIYYCRFTTSIRNRMLFNTIIFTFNMFIIAFELKLAIVELPFFLTWLTTAIGEFVVMLIGIPIVYYLNKRINFEKLIED